MNVTVEPARPDEARHLLEASHALMEASFPSESNHYLSISELEVPSVKFLVARLNGAVVGCGAIAIKDGYSEVKSIFTDATCRGQGVADAILCGLIDATKAADLTIMRLETGGPLKAALRLYERHGFKPRGPFGDYPEDPLSLFYEKVL